MERFKNIDINKKEKLEKIKQILPWVFDDGILNIKKFEDEFSNFSSNDYGNNLERYGLYWNGKTLAKNFANIDSFNTLIYNKNKSLNFNEAENIVIKGDNLEVLKLLKLSYNNKVDVIYIDPPYNTGNDFIYKDNFSQSIENFKYENNLIDDDKNYLTTNQKSDGRFHTKWLDMIYPRLLLSRQLLKDNGLIFISIDDNELSKLQLVCDEIFGENNFISLITWQKKSSGTSSDSKHMKNLNEYVLVYSKNKNLIELNKELLDVNDGSYKLKDEYYSSRGLYKLNALNRRGLTWSEKLDYELTIDGVNFYPGDVSRDKWLIRKEKHATKDWRWRWSKEKVEWGIKNGYVVVIDNKVYSKQYQFVNNNDEQLERETPYTNLILNKEISGSTGTEELRVLFDNLKVFEHPKPTDLIKYLINLNKNKNSLVLDFFAGSGSTAHAVMDLNKIDGGKRKYILVQIHEEVENSKFNEIIDITRERIKRAIEKNNYDDKGFKYFELSPSNLLIPSNHSNEDNEIERIRLSILDQEKRIKDNIKEIDLVYEVGLKNNLFTLDKNVQEFTNIEQKYYVVNNDDNMSSIFFFHPLKNSNYYGDIYIYI